MIHRNLLGYLLILQLGIVICKELDFQDLVFVILSQDDPVHEKKALALESNLLKQTNNRSRVYVTYRDLKHVGDWTVIPILKRLWDLVEEKFIWMFFCTDQTRINVNNLKTSMERYSLKDVFFIGRGLQDSEPTIIHHFAIIPEFSYPLVPAGFGFNYNLLQRIVSVIVNKDSKKPDFSIDASHELALFIKNNVNGTLLTNNNQFCLEYSEECATYVTTEEFCDEMSLNNIFFAVKTCKKFHKERIPIVQATWGKRPHHIAFFSEAYDKSIPTVKLNVPNTEYGHCRKTKAMFSTMKQYLTNSNDLKWVVVSDDDTILSVRRIQKLVGCYDSSKPYAIGERYGFSVYSDSGYNYITGGGGAVLSRAAVFRLAESSCNCPSDSAPDDMYLLGICLQRLNIKLVHIPLFHQARPDDYSQEYLRIGDPVSFHKHWMTDPVQIYKDWFYGFDSQHNAVHAEL